MPLDLGLKHTNAERVCMQSRRRVVPDILMLILCLQILRGGNERDLELENLSTEFGVSIGSISSYISHVAFPLHKILSQYEIIRLKWSTQAERQNMRKLVCGFSDCVAFVNGTMQRIYRQMDERFQEDTYCGQHKFNFHAAFLLTSICRVTIRLEMTWVGSEHDRGLYNDCDAARFLENYYRNNEREISESGFQRDGNQIVLPYKSGQGTGFAHRRQFHTNIRSQRVRNEWSIGIISNFYCLFLDRLPFENALLPIVCAVAAYLVSWSDSSRWNPAVFSWVYDVAPWTVHAETLNSSTFSSVALLTLHVRSSTLSLSMLLTASSSANWSLCSSEKLMSEKSGSRGRSRGGEERWLFAAQNAVLNEWKTVGSASEYKRLTKRAFELNWATFALSTSRFEFFAYSLARFCAYWLWRFMERLQRSSRSLRIRCCTDEVFSSDVIVLFRRASENFMRFSQYSLVPVTASPSKLTLSSSSDGAFFFVKNYVSVIIANVWDDPSVIFHNEVGVVLSVVLDVTRFNNRFICAPDSVQFFIDSVIFANVMFRSRFGWHPTLWVRNSRNRTPFSTRLILRGGSLNDGTLDVASSSFETQMSLAALATVEVGGKIEADWVL